MTLLWKFTFTSIIFKAICLLSIKKEVNKAKKSISFNKECTELLILTKFLVDLDDIIEDIE